MFSIARRDLLKPMVLPPENYELYPTLADVQAFQSPVFAFDLEWDRNGDITLCGLTDRLYQAIVIPWQEPFIGELKRIFESATDIIGQNIIMADWQHLERLGWNVKARLHDTMLKQHLIQPDMRHGLHFIASVFTNKVFWKGGGKEKDEEEEGNVAYEATGAQWKTWNDPLRGIPREQGGYFGCVSADEAFRLYNARDNDGTFQANVPIHQTLVKYGMESIYWNISVPVAHECRRMSGRGIRIDRTKIREVNEKLTTEITEVELRLPEGLRPFGKSISRSHRLDTPIIVPKRKECRGTKKKAHEVCEWTFEKEGEWECPGCGKLYRSGKLKVVKTEKREEIKIIRPYASSRQLQVYAGSVGCKDIKNRKTGRKTTGKSARKVWGREHTEFTLVDILKKLSTLKNNFAKGKLLDYDRIYFQLLPHGTSEGRLSCRGLRDGIDPNIQNQPKSIRGIYIPDYSDWGFVEADWSQGENWLTAFLANDRERLARLGTPGYDEHSDLASRCFKVEVSKTINKHLRNPGKVVNHGKNYGMGVNHMQENLAMEGFNYSLADVKEMNIEWERLNEGTARWQKETVNKVKSQGYLENPFGRKRWFSSRDYATKGLAFNPASTLADMMLRVIIALNPRDYSQEISSLGIQVVANLPPQWFLAWTVHDSFILTGPWKYHREAAQQLRAVMEQKWNALDGFNLSCDITGSDVSWGEMKEIEGI
jgi:DNA polymerase I-like protein with 3'-5' exonuclease and polymerase domains